nr:unnamed protein product [Papilio xuthus]
MIRAINEYAISLINYYIGVLNLEPETFKKIDDEVRQILIHNGIHLQPACKERLYLPRVELGRGLVNIEHRSEMMLFKLLEDFTKTSLVIRRRAAILKVQGEERTHFWLIQKYCEDKYKTVSKLNVPVLLSAQKQFLYNNIKTKTFHQKLYKGVSNENVSVKDSSIWLKHGNIPAKREAALCFLQDRNMFLGEVKKCPHCGNASKTVDHLASKCEKMLGTDYTRRHNEVLKCIHLLLCNKYGVRSTKKLKNHSVQEIVSNKFVEIRVDTFVKTDIKIKHNRPDIVVIDKRTKEILVVEVGITSLDNLQQVETEKLRKYDVLANELTQMYGFKATIVPFVLTWDGVVSKYHQIYRRRLELSDRIEAYIQSLVLKKTLEGISLDFRRNESLEEFFSTERSVCLGAKRRTRSH